MGCDIHAVIEFMPNGDKSEWRMTWAQDIWFGRDYDLFALMADVRNRGIESVFLPRGFPDDAAIETREWFDEHGGDHTPSWLTLDELKEVRTRLAALPEPFGCRHRELEATIAAMEHLPGARLVFNFDN